MRIGRKGKNLQRFLQKMDQLDFAAIAYSPAGPRRFRSQSLDGAAKWSAGAGPQAESLQRRVRLFAVRSRRGAHQNAHPIYCKRPDCKRPE
jgi:hypothetical protein